MLIRNKTRPLYPPPAADFETIGSIAELDAVAGGSRWQGFERLAAYIFGQHDFEVSVGTVINRNGKRRQYDVIARRDGRTLLAECKQWSGRRYRISALRHAVVQHRERAQFYETITREASIPLIVTLIDEDIRIIDSVPLVPVHRLNAFIGELDHFTEGFPCPEYQTADTAVTSVEDSWNQEEAYEEQ
ncbi:MULTISPECIES: restriction endonuclease [unclassified Methanoregula]|uniref:restriction endonuclease n=1 Tax=unclassified Methanoregula TaxID=2649730 RepID=UPI0009C66DF7|nr:MULTISPECIES: restriction endonuclease [unclassified Methanoregula]OPX65321.1 MAG: hypothetical protein A4E33_00354 [Methanoregula sp. PtaB.Bin085]OPY32230.1 MAG: hypothetical protein A4E34_02604 [Methanoregula sp. PtaU1.Bin006]